MESNREEISTQELEDSVYCMQNENLRQEVAKLKNLVSHLGWHCHVYRKTLAKLPNCLVTYAETEKEVLSEPTPPCRDCEMDELLLQLQQMRNEMRKRKRDDGSD